MHLKLLIASSNLHKVREFKSMLKPLGVLDIYSLVDFPSYTPPKEEGATFEEIVSLKATDAAKFTGLLTIADDSGLIVPALNGEPGIFSARYAGVDATDQDNRLKLISKMKHLKDDSRNAYFLCALAIASPDRLLKCVTGTCEGQILEAPRGGNGFGYDPLFMKHDYGKTFAEMDEALKNRVSHRQKAFSRLLPYLQQQIDHYVSHN